MTTKDLIRLYREYQKSSWYHSATDLNSFIGWLAEKELL